MSHSGIKLEDLVVLAPELAVLITAILLSIIDLLLPDNKKRTLIGYLTLVGLAVSAVFVIGRLGSDPVSVLGFTYRSDDFANLMKLFLLGSTALVVYMSIGFVRRDGIQHEGEYYFLYLPAVLGGMIMVSSADLITLFVGLETLSITSYILVGIRKLNPASNESAFKYAVLGAVSSAVILYGMSFLYGMSGSTGISAIQTALNTRMTDMGPLIYVSFFLLLAGFGFKIAAFPFHTWAPDVYRGASTPVTAFLAVISKGAALAVLFRLMYGVYFGLGHEYAPYPIAEDAFLTMAVVAAAAMIAGNAAALRQTNAKRLFAYSGIANAGYLLVPIAARFSLVHYTNFSEFLYYLIAYGFMNLGIFAAIMIIEASTGDTEIKGFAGLYYRAPWLAIATILILLSLAGLPITGGFFGKLFIMLGAVENQQYWLAAVMIGTSVLSLYYYFNIARQMFMRYEEGEKPVKASIPLAVSVWICAVAGVLMGLFPDAVVGFIQNIFSLHPDLFT